MKKIKKSFFSFLGLTALTIIPFSTASAFGPFSSNKQADLDKDVFCAHGVGFPYAPGFAQLRSDTATCFFPEEAIGSTTLEGGLEVMGWDLIRVNWSDAKNICESATILGKNDWFLPTIDDIAEMHAARWQIGGFHNGSYWSATEFEEAQQQQNQFNNSHANNNDRAWAYAFVEGVEYREFHNRQTERFEVRCVRR